MSAQLTAVPSDEGTYVAWDELLERWSAWMLAGHMSKDTVGLRTYHLTRLARSFSDPASITTEQLQDWLNKHDWKPTTARSYRASFRSFWSWAVKTGRLAATPAHDLPRIKVPRAVPRPTPDQVFRFGLLIGDRRDRRILMMGGVCAMRRSEIARSHTDHLEPDLDGWCLRVVGKGGHVRRVPLPEEMARELLACPEGYFFPSPKGGHLTPAHVGVLAKRALETHSTHTLRHRAGTKAYDATKDIRAVQEFMGHADPKTTAIYTLVTPSAIRAAMEGARLTGPAA